MCEPEALIHLTGLQLVSLSASHRIRLLSTSSSGLTSQSPFHIASKSPSRPPSAILSALSSAYSSVSLSTSPSGLPSWSPSHMLGYLLLRTTVPLTLPQPSGSQITSRCLLLLLEMSLTLTPASGQHQKVLDVAPELQDMLWLALQALQQHDKTAHSVVSLF
jgi:hypothetical protein